MIKKRAKNNSPKVVEDCRELLLWLIPHLDKFPKNRRYTLGEKLEERLLTLLENLIAAAYSHKKKPLLQQANLDLEVSRHLWRLSHDFQAISHKSYAHGSQLMLELGKQIGGWIRASP